MGIKTTRKTIHAPPDDAGPDSPTFLAPLTGEKRQVFGGQGKDSSVPRPDLALGVPVGDFLPLRKLGAGVTGTVYLARQISLQREVALKVSSNFGGDLEARIQARLDHDHIVRVYSETLGPLGHIRLLCMQYIPGYTLEQLIRRTRGGLSPRLPAAVLFANLRKDAESATRAFSASGAAGNEGGEGAHAEIMHFPADLDLVGYALWVGIQVAKALDYAHQKGVLHLDVKPNNILIDHHGRPYLTDFSISIECDQQTQTLRVLGGTVGYMAPEQIAMVQRALRGESVKVTVDYRADIFSLGVVLERWLDDKTRPKTGGTESVPLETGIQFVIRKCTSQDMGIRYRSAADAAAALQGCLELRSIMRSFALPGPWSSWVTKHALGIQALLTTMAAVLGSIGVFQYAVAQSSQARTPEYFAIAVTLVLAFYVGSAFLWASGAAPVAHYLDDAILIENLSAHGAQMRAWVLQGPERLMKWFSVLWLSVHVIVGILLSLDSGAPWQISGRVFVLTSLIGLVSASQSILLNRFTGLRFLYPRLWLESGEVRSVATTELTGLARATRPYLLLAIAAPLFALVALNLMPCRPDSDLGSLNVGLSLASLIGLGIVFFVSHAIARFVFLFTGRDVG